MLKTNAGLYGCKILKQVQDDNIKYKKICRNSLCRAKNCVKEQPVQEYLTDSSEILGQINLET